MDVLDASGSTITAHTSVMQELKDSGGGIYVPVASTSTMVTHSSGVALIFAGTPETARLAMETIGAVVTTTSRYFEQLEFPMKFLLDYPDQIEVCLNDGPTRWQSGVTATIDSICTGDFDSGSKWVETKEQVPCIPRYPMHATPSLAADKCKAHPSSGQRTPVGPYVPYVTTWSLLD